MEQEIMSVGAGLLSIIVVFLVQGLKNAGMPKEYSFIAAACIGLVTGVAYSLLGGGISIVAGVFGGLLSGAAASGIYSGGKTMLKK